MNGTKCVPTMAVKQFPIFKKIIVALRKRLKSEIKMEKTCVWTKVKKCKKSEQKA